MYYYILQIELRDCAEITVLNKGIPFHSLEHAQIVCNEIFSEQPKDRWEYIKLEIVEQSKLYEVLVEPGYKEVSK